MNKYSFGSVPPSWQVVEGEGPVLATAIHNGHFIPFEDQLRLLLSPIDRLREEDPYTREWTRIAPTQVVGSFSRFWV